MPAMHLLFGVEKRKAENHYMLPVPAPKAPATQPRNPYAVSGSPPYPYVPEPVHNNAAAMQQQAEYLLARERAYLAAEARRQQGP